MPARGQSWTQGVSLVEATLRCPFDWSEGEVKTALEQTAADFWTRHPSIEATLYPTFNFVLQGERADGTPSYYLEFGADYRESEDRTPTAKKPVVLTSASEISGSLIPSVEGDAIKKILDRNYQNSGVRVHSFVNRVFVFRGQKVASYNAVGREGRPKGWQDPIDL